MREGPDIARVANLIGDPARANMLTALMGGKALTATELAHHAGVTVQTTSSHLKQLSEGGLLISRKQGRHRYFALSGPKVAELLGMLMGFADDRTEPKPKTGPKDAALRHARVCYKHLAGNRGVQLYDSFVRRGFLQISQTGRETSLTLTKAGEAFATDFGIDLATLKKVRSPLCRECLDWSERRSHLAGSIGRALLSRMEEIGWVLRTDGSRVVQFTQRGEAEFDKWF